MKVANSIYHEAATCNRPLCLSNASGVGSLPRNCTKTCTQQHYMFNTLGKHRNAYIEFVLLKKWTKQIKL